MNNKTKIWLPLMLAAAVCVGILAGNFYARRASAPSADNVRQPRPVFGGMTAGTAKLNALLSLVQNNYVEDVNMDSLVEKVLPDVLDQLDPHSTYIPASELQAVNEDLDGSFHGIGVQFNIQNDTVMIVAVISGGPSERLGILPGDRIVTVNDSAFVGSGINNDVVMKKLRGKLGTHVRVGVRRNGAKEVLNFDIERAEIPVNSVDASYVIAPRVGYIKVGKFAFNTNDEFFNALVLLHKKGCSKFIIDLRGNPGGYLDAATAMVNEFLPKNQLIVYTEGKAMPREDVYADGTGICQTDDVVVLIDEWSASASEIFAGAIQDNDRGLIVGRRSFGKGLVQNQVPFPDSSAVRLTVAKYFTPSGRCIQKPFEHGKIQEYEEDIMNRYLRGEFDQRDSIKMNDSLRYTTRGGRTVYGGGGIMPDIFVARDTSEQTAYYNRLVNLGYVYQFAFQYADRHRAELQQYKTWPELVDHLRSENLPAGLADFAAQKGVARNPYSLRKSSSLFQNLLEAYICRDILGENGFYPVLNQSDITVKRALEALATPIGN